MDILNKISDCILNMDEENIENLIKSAIHNNDIDINDIFIKGLNNGMIRAINTYDNREYDIPELIVCADTLNKGIRILREHGVFNKEDKGKVLLSVVEGDTHEIGKNIVKIMVEASGYEVIDIGVNKSSEEIIDTAIKENVNIIGLSSMMTTTRDEMRKVINKINSMNLKNRPYVIVGGGSVTESYSNEIGAEGYYENAPNAIKLIERLLRR